MWIHVEFLGYVLPKFTQLTVTSYYAASSGSHYGISLLTRHIEENYSSKTHIEENYSSKTQHLKRLWWFLSGGLTRKIHYLPILFALPSCGWLGLLKFYNIFVTPYRNAYVNNPCLYILLLSRDNKSIYLTVICSVSRESR